MRCAAIQQSVAVVPTGIRGFDLLTPGGLPKGKVTLVVGSSGAGKTVFAMQMAVTNAIADRPGVYVSFEESPREILANISTFEWSDAPRVRRNVHVLDGDLGPDAIVCGTFDLCGLIALLDDEFRQYSAAWVVLDGLDQLLGLLADPVGERREIYRLKRWVEESGAACLITAKEDAGGWTREIGQADGLVAFAADCVVRLSVDVSGRVIHRRLRVVKYRGADRSGGERPIVITSQGILLDHVCEDTAAEVSRERLSTGIAELDEHLQGGYLRGSSVLISGQPGTCKTTLAACLAISSCQRRERVLMVLFGEGAEQMRVHLRSVSIDLDQPLQAGSLRMESAAVHNASPEEHLVRIVAWMEEFNPSVLIIDPVSALTSADGDLVAQRILRIARQRGITTLFTVPSGCAEAPRGDQGLQMSTVADTWIHLDYGVDSGERNRSLSIIKARGTRHSNRVRELVLDDSGLRMADLFVGATTLRMGSPSKVPGDPA